MTYEAIRFSKVTDIGTFGIKIHVDEISLTVCSCGIQFNWILSLDEFIITY